MAIMSFFFVGGVVTAAWGLGDQGDYSFLNEKAPPPKLKAKEIRELTKPKLVCEQGGDKEIRVCKMRRQRVVGRNSLMERILPKHCRRSIRHCFLANAR